MARINNHRIHYILCGQGKEQIALECQAKRLNLHENIHFLGYREDVVELYKISDCFIMPSKREGLSRALMEAMASGLPCVVSNIRGNVDLVKNGYNGYVCAKNTVEVWKRVLVMLIQNIERNSIL